MGFAAMVVGLTMVVECGVVAADMLYSSKLVHRFSDEVRKLGVSRNGEVWPQHRSLEYYGRLMSSDLQRQKMKLGPQFQLLFPSEGSKTMPLGNDFGWSVTSFSFYVAHLTFQFVLKRMVCLSFLKFVPVKYHHVKWNR